MSKMEDDVEDTTFRRAIEDVMVEGVGVSDDDETFSLDDIDDENDDFIIQDIDDIDDIALAEGDGDESDTFALPDDDEEDEGADEIIEDEDHAPLVDDGKGLRAIETARYILDFESRASAVANFEEEWEEEMGDPEARRAYVEEMFEALESALSEEGDQIVEFSALDAGDDAREIDWLQENEGRWDECKMAIIDAIAPAHQEVADDLDGDLDSAFSIGISALDEEMDGSEAAEFDDESGSANIPDNTDREVDTEEGVDSDAGTTRGKAGGCRDISRKTYSAKYFSG